MNKFNLNLEKLKNLTHLEADAVKGQASDTTDSPRATWGSLRTC